MAIKPLGKAIIILTIVSVIGGGVIYSGALDKLPAPKVEEIKIATPDAVVSMPQVVIQQPTHSDKQSHQPAPAVEADSGNDAAFDAVMKAAAAKKGTK